MSFLKKVEDFAREAHKGQYRKYNGEPYIVHPERVARRTADFTQDAEVIAAAWLHDVIEDCEVTFSDLAREFGNEVANFVDELTNPSKKFPRLNREQRKAMDREHLAECGHITHLIKAIDRIDNLRDMVGAPHDFRTLYGRESKQLAEALKLAPDILLWELWDIADSLARGTNYAQRGSGR